MFCFFFTDTSKGLTHKRYAEGPTKDVTQAEIPPEWDGNNLSDRYFCSQSNNKLLSHLSKRFR